MISTPLSSNGTPASRDGDPEETQEWLDALDGVLVHEGPARARELLERVVERAHSGGAQVELGVQTPYINTIPASQQPRMPGNDELETRIRHFIRWNAMAMVVRANETSSELGGHVASFASSATLYDVGFNHFFRAPTETFGGDLVFFQGHSAPGVYARAYLEGRISEEQLAHFRQEVDGHGLSSYPHSWLMPEFWQFATVSMGLGPIQAIYQARFLKYLQNRGIADTRDRKVWCFLGDGEVDEPESLGAISVAARENLDNLIFVVNCNLQRLDGPVRGNGKIIQELERQFRGSGWNVIKVIWGRGWDELLARDHSGRLIQLMTECVDGEYQAFKANDGGFVREHFFGRYPETAAMVSDWTDAQIWDLGRGGHDPRKIYAAYAAAVTHTGRPTVVLAKTIKGYGMGSSGEAQNVAHQQKHLDLRAMRQFRDRFSIPISDAELGNVPFYRPPDDSAEAQYLQERLRALGHVPQRRRKSSKTFAVPELSTFAAQLQGSGERELSTTMAFTRILSALVKDKDIGRRVVPIVADESRTFGMEGMFRQLGIYSPLGQLYRPQDSAQLMYYREDVAGQILQEGISEAGAMCSWIAAATSYSTSDEPMIPLFIFYSMFGFQRIGDLMWAAGDMRSRGFLIGGTSGRTTLNGEGLQHEDGQSQISASFVPNCISYDPAFGYELAVIMREGLRRMICEQEDVYYYITVMNENYRHPAMPEGAETGIIKGMYLLRDAGATDSSGERAPSAGSLIGSQAPPSPAGLSETAPLTAGRRESRSSAASDPTPAGRNERPSRAGSAAASNAAVTRESATRPRVQLVGSGAILREVLAAADILGERYGVDADVWSATSYNELRRDGLETARWNLLHPEEAAHVPYVAAQLKGRPGPVVAASDYMKSYADGIRPFVERRFHALGTDGYGRSDYRRKLRAFFEVDRHWIALAALGALAADGAVERQTVAQARDAYGIDSNKPSPVSV